MSLIAPSYSSNVIYHLFKCFLNSGCLVLYFQAFEDFEFSQMEEEAKRESEKEEMAKEIT